MLIKNKLPFETGDCATCLEENIPVLKCTTNNKCEYAMCSSCMTELKYITKTTLCPNCREVKVELVSDEEIIIEFSSDTDDDDDDDDDEIIYEENCLQSCYDCCCVKVLISFYICCCLDCCGGSACCYYELVNSCFNTPYFRRRPRLRKVCVLSVMIFILLSIVFIGGYAYSAFFGTHPIRYLRTNFALFIFHSLMGILLLFCLIFFIVLLAMCCCGDEY